MVQHAGLNVSQMSIISVTKQNIYTTCLAHELKKKNTSSFGFIYLNKLIRKNHGIYYAQRMV